MHILLLSDFSEVAINATHYAMDLLRDEKATFTLMNIHVPNSKALPEERERKRIATKGRLQERVDKLKERSQGRSHTVKGFYSEDNLVNATRDFLIKNSVDLLVMGAVSKDMRETTILGDFTFEIISKIKCNLLAVPENVQYRTIRKTLMPIDTTVSFNEQNLLFLRESKFLKNTELNVWDLAPKTDQNNLNLAAFKSLKEIELSFFNLEERHTYDRNIWLEVQKNFDIIAILAKNIKICSHIMHSKHGLYLSAPNRLPIFVLHD